MFFSLLKQLTVKPRFNILRFKEYRIQETTRGSHGPSRTDWFFTEQS